MSSSNSTAVRFAAVSLVALIAFAVITAFSLAWFPATSPQRSWAQTDHQVDYYDRLSLFAFLIPPVLLLLLSHFVLSPLSSNSAVDAALSNKILPNQLSSSLWRVRWQFKLILKVWGAWSLGEVLVFTTIVLCNIAWWITPPLMRILQKHLTAPRQIADKFGQYAGYAAMWDAGAALFFVIRENALLRHAFGPEAGQYHRTIRLHIVFGYLSLFFVSFHGIYYLVTYAADHTFATNMFPWNSTRGYMNAAGFVSWIALIIVAVTSIYKLRRKSYNVFYWTHQLYIVFILAALVHTYVGWWILVAPMLYFVYDRFVPTLKTDRNTTARITQITDSLFRIDIPIRASRALTSTYAPGDYLNINIPAISSLNWHPFSVMSYHPDSPNTFSLVVKARGPWTKHLHALFNSASTTSVLDDKYTSPNAVNINNHYHVHVPIKVQGPFGSRATGYLAAHTLVAVAGGAGISSLTAYVLHFAKMGTHQSRKVHVVWSVKAMEDVTAYADFLEATKILEDRVQVHLHVTQEMVKKDSVVTLVGTSGLTALKEQGAEENSSTKDSLQVQENGFLVSGEAFRSGATSPTTPMSLHDKEVPIQSAKVSRTFELILLLLVFVGGAAGFSFARLVEFNFDVKFGTGKEAYKTSGTTNFVIWYWYNTGPWLMATAFALVSATATVTAYKFFRRSTDNANPLNLNALPVLPAVADTDAPNVYVARGRPDLNFHLDSLKTLVGDDGNGPVVVMAAGPEQMVREVEGLALSLKLEFHRESFKV